MKLDTIIESVQNSLAARLRPVSDRINESSVYDELEDADEFGICKVCGQPGTNIPLNSATLEPLNVAYCDKCKEQHNRDWHREWLTESSEYDELEDADEFAEEFDWCDGCLRNFRSDDLNYCQCDGVWCDNCEANRNGFDWVPEYNWDNTNNPDLIANQPNVGNMIQCPRCDQNVRIAESEYDELEDADEFESWSREIAGMAECDVCGIAIPLDTPVPDADLYEELDRLSLILWPHGYHGYSLPDKWFCNVGCMTKKHDELKRKIKSLNESVYDELEDADKFEPQRDICMHCGQPEVVGLYHILGCDNLYDTGCPNKTCENCMNKNGWSYDYATDTGPIIICPECQT